ncbi:MAG: hypothetical protein WC915_05600 [archaeon]
MIEIITTSFFVFSSIYGGPGAAGADNAPVNPGLNAPMKEVGISTNIPLKEDLEKKVKAYFKDDPILVDIARCESRFRQYDENGVTLRGKVNKGDLGIMQINEYYHAEKAESMGFNLHDAEGNLAYAKYLYEKEGGQPWISSSKCWRHGNQVAMK